MEAKVPKSGRIMFVVILMAILFLASVVVFNLGAPVASGIAATFLYLIDLIALVFVLRLTRQKSNRTESILNKNEAKNI